MWGKELDKKMELNSSFNCKREGHTICGSKMGRRGVSSGFNYEKRYTYRLGHESRVSSGFKCKKGNGHTSWNMKME